MRGVGIVTDPSAQFLTPRYPGYKRVHTLPLSILWNRQRYASAGDELAASLPPSLLHRTPPRLILPTEKEILEQLRALARRYDALLLLPMGSNLSAALFERVVKAASVANGGYPIYTVDTQTTGAGLGWLVQVAAAHAENGENIFAVLRSVRAMVHHIYTVLCARALTYLDHNGFLEPSQAIIGEMLELYPLFVLEDGRLAPLHKSRSSRHLLDLMQEFAAEFSLLQGAVITYHPHHFHREAHNLRDRLLHFDSPFPVHLMPLNNINAVLFGPRTIALYLHTA